MASLVVRMPPAGLTALRSPVWSYQSRTACSITWVTGSVAAGEILPVEVLMKSRAGQQGQPGRPADVVVGGQLAGLQDDLEPGRSPQACLTATISSNTCAVVAGQERAAVDHHVDLGGAGVDGELGVGELDRQGGAPGREGRGDRGDADAGAGEFRRPRCRPCPGRRTAPRPVGCPGRRDPAGAPWRPASGPCRGCRSPPAWSGRPSRWPGRSRRASTPS